MIPKCKNCGAEQALHHYKTMQCPVGGREAPIDRKQEWMSLTFQPETESDLLTRIEALEEQEELFRTVWITSAGYVQESVPGTWDETVAAYHFLIRHRKVWIVDSENKKIDMEKRKDDQA